VAIATAHHADDVAETVLLRIIRGAGIRGVGALPPSRPLGAEHPGVRVVRPLMEVGKDELVAFLEGKGEPFCVDSSNLSSNYARNWVRHDLIPLLRRECPTFSVRSLCALNASALEASRFLDEALDDIWPNLCRCAGPGGVGLDQKALAEAAEPLRKIAADRALRVLARQGDCPPALRFEHYDKLVALPSREVGAQVLLPGGFLARREHGLVYFSRLSSALPLPAKRLTVPGRVELPEVGMSITCARMDGVAPEEAARKASASEVFLNPEEAGEPLVVRSRRPGDRFHPLGAPGPARLKKFLIGRKVPLHERDRIPLVTTCDGEIAWVVGHRIGERFKLQKPTGCALHLTAQRASPQRADREPMA
jgi:tRNA(Ile)-lysidine synthase